MRTDELPEILKLDLLAQHAEYLKRIATPCVDIWSRQNLVQGSASRFGGSPFLPADFVLPQPELGEYRFLGQINFSEIELLPTLLPNVGLLSLFYNYEERGATFVGSPDFLIGYYWDRISHFTDSDIGANPNSMQLEMVGGLQLPLSSELRTDWPFDNEAMDSLLYDGREVVGIAPDHLLGYPRFNTLAYDPTPDVNWTNLISIRSIDDLGWCWRNGDMLMVFIETEKLKNKDFSTLKCDAG